MFKMLLFQEWALLSSLRHQRKLLMVRKDKTFEVENNELSYLQSYLNGMKVSVF